MSFKSIVFFGLLTVSCGQKNVDSDVSSVSFRQVDPDGSSSQPTRETLMVFYVEDGYILRGVCDHGLFADPKSCDPRVPENRRNLKHTFGVRLKKFEQLFELIAPAKSQILSVLIETVRNQNILLKNELNDVNRSQSLDSLREAQLKKNEQTLLDYQKFNSDRDYWLEALKSPIVYEIGFNKANDLDKPFEKIKPFVEVTKQVFIYAENLEYKLHNWTCTTQCKIKTVGTYTKDFSQVGPLRGRIGYAGDVYANYETHVATSATGHQTEAEAKAEASTACMKYSGSASWGNSQDHHERGIFRNIDPSGIDVSVATIESISCNLKDPKPVFTPQKFPY